jgi:apolipoprotein N-acyltransferase
MGGVICYESIFPDIVRKTVNSGAEFITFLTDDSWFGSTCALKQHTSHSMLRAVENNIPWLQCSNTGITCIINQNGEMTEDIDIQKSGILSGTIEIQATYNERNKTTLYTFWGDYPVILMILCFLIYFKFKKEVLQ